VASTGAYLFLGPILYLRGPRLPTCGALKQKTGPRLLFLGPLVHAVTPRVSLGVSDPAPVLRRSNSLCSARNGRISLGQRRIAADTHDLPWCTLFSFDCTGFHSLRLSTRFGFRSKSFEFLSFESDTRIHARSRVTGSDCAVAAYSQVSATRTDSDEGPAMFVSDPLKSRMFERLQPACSLRRYALGEASLKCDWQSS
jgi:hypothetical protein